MATKHLDIWNDEDFVEICKAIRKSMNFSARAGYVHFLITSWAENTLTVEIARKAVDDFEDDLAEEEEEVERVKLRTEEWRDEYLHGRWANPEAHRDAARRMEALTGTYMIGCA
jgi:hypothetical protein